MFTAVRAILDVSTVVVATSATLDCTLPCFSPDLQCSLFNITTNDNDVRVVTNTTSPVVGSLMTYSHPTQQINVSNLLVNKTYEYCVTAIDILIRKKLESQSVVVFKHQVRIYVLIQFINYSYLCM